MIVSLPRPPLLIITDLPKPPWTVEGIVKIALEAGCRWIMYRDKTASIELFKQTAATLVGLCNKYNAKVCINERIEVAEVMEGTGVHLQSSYEVPSAKRRLCPSASIGDARDNAANIAPTAHHITCTVRRRQPTRGKAC